MIASWVSKESRRIFDGEASRDYPPHIQRVARRKLRTLHVARSTDDLRTPPGKRLELLRGDRAGQHSIRINDQYRICFRWVEGAAHDVEIVDYH